MRKTTAQIFLGLLVTGTIALCLFFYWWFYPYNPLTVENAPIPVQPPQITDGPTTTVIATLKSCKYMDVTPIVVRTIIGDGAVVATPAYTGAIHATGCSTLKQAIIIPQLTQPGVYHIHWHVTYQVNPIRTVVVQYDSQNFTVGASK